MSIANLFGDNRSPWAGLTQSWVPAPVAGTNVSDVGTVAYAQYSRFGNIVSGVINITGLVQTAAVASNFTFTLPDAAANHSGVSFHMGSGNMTTTLDTLHVTKTGAGTSNATVNWIATGSGSDSLQLNFHYAV